MHKTNVRLNSTHKIQHTTGWHFSVYVFFPFGVNYFKFVKRIESERQTKQVHTEKQIE